MNFRLTSSLAGACLLTLGAGLCSAAVIQVNTPSNFQNGFDANISNADLINSGASTLGSFVASRAGAFSEAGTNDGGVGNSYWNTGAPVELTYTLTGSATGYDITSINTIYAWTDSRLRHAAQRYEVAVTTVINPTFSLLHTVLYDPFTDSLQGSTQVNLTDDAGLLATGVTAIRFTATTDNGSEVGVIAEYDVVGVVTPVPEPTSLAFGALALGMIGLRRRR